MSIEYSPVFDRGVRGLRNEVTARAAFKPRQISQRRIDANRRNARKSTGPRTPEGKRRASHNAFKHGLCAATAVPACEDLPTFNMFADELRKELNPQTVVQKILFPQIAQLAWNLRRFPEAHAAMFQHELDKEPESKPMTASELLAKRFSDEPSNGFALLGRYERANQAMFLRLLNQFHKIGKAAANTKPDPDERVPQEYVPAISPVQMVQQEMAFNRRMDEREQYIPPRNEREAQMDRALDAMATQKKRSPNRANEKQPISAAERHEVSVRMQPIAGYETNPRRSNPTGGRRPSFLTQSGHANSSPQSSNTNSPLCQSGRTRQPRSPRDESR